MSADATVRDVGDVVVEDAARVTIQNPEDVFVEQGAVTGEFAVADAGDAYLRPDAGAEVVRDVVLDGGREVRIDGAEDVAVTAGAVAGDLAVEGAGDVYVGATDGLLLESVEDVYLEPDCFDGGRATVRDAQDVVAEPNAVDGELTVENPEDVLVGDGIEVKREQYDTSYETAPDRLRLVDVEDVDLPAGALTDRVWVTDAEWVGGR